MLDIIISLVLKYAHSHMYDIYAFLAGTIAYVIIMALKALIKKEINKYIIFISSVILGAVIFLICSDISPQVYVSAHSGRGVGSILYASGIAFGEYVIIDMISNRLINIIGIIFTFVVAMFANIYLCNMMETHYKACYGLKLGVAFCCAIGLIRMVLGLGEKKERN